jgi:DNA-directed RNA polymerase specialized sigma24 family protein
MNKQQVVDKFDELPAAIAIDAEKLLQYWRERLATECSQQSVANRESIIIWLVRNYLEQYEVLSSKERKILDRAMNYRYSILHQRYVGMDKEVAYRNLINRLASVLALRYRIQTWVATSRDRHRSVLDVLQEIIPELLHSDKYMHQEMARITKITTDDRLKNALLLASIEEYCLRPVRSQPLITYRFFNYQHSFQRGGLTQVPNNEVVRLVSEEIMTQESDSRVSLVDIAAIAEYQLAQDLEEQQALRQAVKQEFENYLLANFGQLAVEWLQLYLLGKSQDEIAKRLNQPIEVVYRLREKISYHAIRVFAIKSNPELVGKWLSISLLEHNLGLTSQEFHLLYEKLTPIQRSVLELCKVGYSTETIAQHLHLKNHQVMGHWTKIYLVAQTLRTQNRNRQRC